MTGTEKKSRAASDKSDARTRRKQPRQKKVVSEKKSLVVQAYEAIKERILSLQFMPGQYLNEASISQLLGLGRTPVHQALQRLQLEGLVEIVPRKGVIVEPDSILKVIEILDARMLLEGALVRVGAQNCTDEQIKNLEAILKELKKDRDVSTIDHFVNHDRAFHTAIAKLSGSDILSDYVCTLHERSSRYWYLHFWQTLDPNATSRQHRGILEALRKRDGEKAEQALKEHLGDLKLRLKQIWMTHNLHGRGGGI